VEQPLLHPTSQKLLESRLNDLPQALIITGKSGTGTLAVAAYISRYFGSPEVIIMPKKKAKDSKSFDIDEENGRVLTEDIRSLYDSVRGKQPTPRVFIIHKADRMMPNAQHALLKLLEEPGENIYFILETYNTEALFPTIRSRAQTLTILPITPEQTSEYIKDRGISDATKRIQLKFIAEGLPAELDKLISDEAYFKIRAERMNDARQFLQSAIFERLLIVQKYQSSREGALQLIDSAIHITNHTVSNKPQLSLIAQLDALLKVRERIAANQNIRLQLTDFVL
jgi:DNA polymerase III delta prime subunit